MSNNLKLGSVVGVAAAIALVIGLVVGYAAHGGISAGGINVEKEVFVNGIWANSPAEQIVDNEARWIGEILTGSSATSSFAGPTIMTGSFTPDAIGSGALTLTATTTAQTLTAAQVCDNAVIDWPTTTSTGALTLPTAVALQADCLDTVGSYRDVVFRNTNSVATSSYSFTAGASSTIKANYATSSQSTNAVDSTQGAILRFVYGTSTTSNATMVQILAGFFR